MPRRCTVCDHSERGEIEAALVSGEPYRDIARQYSVSKDALARHRTEHIPEHLAKAQDAAEVAEADDLLGKVRELQSRTEKILEAAERDGELRTALAAIREARGLLELLGKLAGELQTAPTVSITIAAHVQQTILAALESYPEAKLAVADALGELESRDE